MYNQLYNIYKKLYKMHPDNFLSYLSHITESPLLLQDIVKSFKNIRQKTIKSGLMFLDLSNYLFTMSLFCILSLLAKTIKGLLFCRSLPQDTSGPGVKVIIECRWHTQIKIIQRSEKS